MRGQFNISIQVTAFIITFVLTLIAGPILIPILRRLKVGQTVRDDGPVFTLRKAVHLQWEGLYFDPCYNSLYILFLKQYPEVISLFIATLGFGIIGFIDDFIKVVLKGKMGLPGNRKCSDCLLSLWYLLYTVRTGILNTEIIVPLKNGLYCVSHVVFVPLLYLFFLQQLMPLILLMVLMVWLLGSNFIIMVFFTIVA